MKHRVAILLVGCAIGLALAVGQIWLPRGVCGPAVERFFDVGIRPVNASLEVYVEVFHDGNMDAAIPVAIPMVFAYWIFIGVSIAAGAYCCVGSLNKFLQRSG